MTVPDPPPTLDLHRLAFPTDRVTIADLRKRQPLLFDDESPPEPDDQPPDLDIVATMAVERILARKAFARAAQLADPHPRTESLSSVTRQEAVLMLNEDYKLYGISSGLQQTRLLVREFENEAISQVHSRGR